MSKGGDSGKKRDNRGESKRGSTGFVGPSKAAKQTVSAPVQGPVAAAATGTGALVAATASGVTQEGKGSR